MKRSLPILISSITFLLFASVSFARADLRNWTNKDGREVRAEYLGVEGEKVRVRLKSGREFLIPVVDLEQKDQRYIEKRRSHGNVIGVWGGKWDDTWTVFVEVRAKGSKLVGFYHYEEQVGNLRMDQKEDELEPLKGGSYLLGKSIYLRFEGGKAMAYGDFKNPRMANFTKIADSITDLDLYSMRVEDYGWKKGRIEAEKAKVLVREGFEE